MGGVWSRTVRSSHQTVFGASKIIVLLSIFDTSLSSLMMCKFAELSNNSFGWMNECDILEGQNIFRPLLTGLCWQGGHALVTEFRGMALNGLMCADVLRPHDLVARTDFTYEYQWCGLRLSVLGQTPRRPKKSIFVLQVWCCVVKHDLVTLVVIMILKDTTTYQVLFTVSLFCTWNITTVGINSGVHVLKS